MTFEPKRLLDSCDQPLVSEMLSAGRDEQPSEAAVLRTLRAGGVGAALSLSIASTALAAPSGVSVASSSLSGAGSSISLAVVKWLGIGFVGGLVSASATQQLSSMHEADNDLQAQVSRVSESVASKRPRLHRAAALSAAPSANPMVSPSALASKPSFDQQERVPRSVDTAMPARDAALTLTREVALLDRARTALRAGDAVDAERALVEYERQFTAPRLYPEVLYLRMETALALGNTLQARLRAKQILALYSTGPHASRAEFVLSNSREGEP